MVCFFGCSVPSHDLTDLAARSRKLLELQSCEYVYRDVVYQGRLEKILGLITSKETRVLFSVNLKVKAGIDLSRKLEITPVPASSAAGEPAILLRLPAARILEVDSDENSIHQYFIYEYGLMQEERVKWLDVQDELAKSKEKIKADAIRRGILVKAWDNSGTILKNLFHLAGYKTVLIEPLPENTGEDGKP